MSQQNEITTSQAANSLSVSELFVIMQIEDVMAYKNRMRRDSVRALAELAEEGQKLNIGDIEWPNGFSIRR